MAGDRPRAWGGDMRIEMSGILTSRRAMQNLGDELTKRLNDEIARAAVNTANHARSAVQGGGSGAVYEKYNPRRTHRASAPGQPPATDTGRLVGSITQERSQAATGALSTFLAGSKVEYAKWLEFGTRLMDARPFMRPALRKARAEFVRRTTNLVGARKVRLQDIVKDAP